jgi:hypothetical protein
MTAVPSIAGDVRFSDGRHETHLIAKAMASL